MPPPSRSLEQVRRVLDVQMNAGVSELEALKPGAWSSAFAFESGGERFVIRFSEHLDDFQRDAFAYRFAGPHVPVPRVIHIGEDDGAHVAISQRVAGDYIDLLSGEGFRRTLPSLLTTLDALRTADITDTRGYGGWDATGNGTHGTWPDFLRASRVDRPGERGGGWRPKLEASQTGAEAFDRDSLVFDRLLDDLPTDRHVLHCDLINYNCFVKDDRISGIIDWGCGMYGDFVYEVAWFTFWAPWYPQWQGIDLAHEAYAAYRAIGADVSCFGERLTCYELHIGLTHQAYNAFIGNWDALADVTRHTAAVADKVR